jgi:hypothetical protein
MTRSLFDLFMTTSLERIPRLEDIDPARFFPPGTISFVENPLGTRVAEHEGEGGIVMERAVPMLAGIDWFRALDRVFPGWKLGIKYTDRVSADDDSVREAYGSVTRRVLDVPQNVLGKDMDPADWEKLRNVLMHGPNFAVKLFSGRGWVDLEALKEEYPLTDSPETVDELDGFELGLWLRLMRFRLRPLVGHVHAKLATRAIMGYSRVPENREELLNGFERKLIDWLKKVGIYFEPVQVLRVE